MRICFFGTPAFAATLLKGLIEAGHIPIAVVTQPDKPQG
ncbi:MAG: methionyl-tRNA formyltransferase, partial [Chlamydiota bacterium]